MSFVVDASVAMAWCFRDEQTASTETLFDRLRTTGATVPAIRPLEIAGALLSGERRGRLSEAESARFVRTLGTLPITVDDGGGIATPAPVLALGRGQNLSSYDASYLELAMRQGLPLATLDARLRAATARIGVPLMEEG